MKQTTTVNKLAALLGIAEDTAAQSKHVVEEAKSKAKVKRGVKQITKHPVDIGVSEDEIQSFRAAQGLHYFLQAPELFSLKTCKHCGASFLVSRKYVAFCSYTCIKASLNEVGIAWNKGDDIESLANDPQVYEGNEPIWVRNIDRVKQVLGLE